MNDELKFATRVRVRFQFTIISYCIQWISKEFVHWDTETYIYLAVSLRSITGIGVLIWVSLSRFRPQTHKTVNKVLWLCTIVRCTCTYSLMIYFLYRFHFRRSQCPNEAIAFMLNFAMDTQLFNWIRVKLLKRNRASQKREKTTFGSTLHCFLSYWRWIRKIQRRKRVRRPRN